jgi:hypothetical protein
MRACGNLEDMCHSSAGIESSPAVRSAPREVVLDRFASHTVICPDSMRAYRAFSAARTVFGAAAALGAAVLAAYVGCAAAGGGADAGSLIRRVFSC